MFRRPPLAAPLALIGAMIGAIFAATAAPAARSAPLLAEASPPGGTLNEPVKLPFSEALAREQLRLPPGFWFDVWAPSWAIRAIWSSRRTERCT